jgi:hypothetical protein
MAVDHIVLTVTSTPTPLLTVPKNTPACHVTIQNRDAVNAISVGDNTLGAVSGTNAGILVSNATTAATVTPSTFQMWVNPGDTIYGFCGVTNTQVVVLYSFYEHLNG